MKGKNLETKRNEFNLFQKEVTENEKCPSCNGELITKNPQKDDFLDFLDSIYCKNEDSYMSYSVFVQLKMEKKK